MSRYIDADAFIALCQKWADDEWNKKVAPISWSRAYETVIDDVEKMPTADVEPVRRGRWICENLQNGFGKITCSLCGESINVAPRRYDNLKEYEKFCANCGAKMDGGKI